MEKIAEPLPETNDLDANAKENRNDETASNSMDQVVNSDQEDGKVEEAANSQDDYGWDTDPHNPYNWSTGQKAAQVATISSIAFLTYVHFPVLLRPSIN
jgi:hypothetical protein